MELVLVPPDIFLVAMAAVALILSLVRYRRTGRRAYLFVAAIVVVLYIALAWLTTTPALIGGSGLRK